MTTTESASRVEPPRVLVVGDANLDLVLRGDVVPRFGQAEQLLESADLVLGSSAGIMACGLARLGVETALAARVGDDFFGERTRHLLAAAGVDTSRVLVGSEPTGLSVILSSPDDRAILTLLGAMSALTDDDVRDAASALLPRHVHVASFFLVPHVAVGLPSRLSALRAAGITTSLDTNWDPAGRWDGVQACLPHVDVLLPNSAEVIELARAIGGRPVDAEDAAAQLAALGPSVVVKDGAQGAFAVSAGERARAAGLAIDVVDTTGAGDSFDAGFLTAWLEGRGLAESLRWATAAGSLSTRGAGGTGGQATRDELLDALAGTGENAVITCLGLAPALDVTYAVPELALGAIHRPSSTLRLPGGKSLNVARALHTLDVAATAIVPLGGPIGDLVRDALEAEGIPADIVSTSAPTRLCVSIIDEASAAMTEVYEQAPPIDDEDWRGILALVADVDDGWLAVSGAIPAARETDLAATLAAAAGRGVRLALDVRGGALRETLARTRPELVKINRSEAEETFGAGDAAALAHLLHNAGAAAAIVTDGPGGSVAVDRTGASRVQPPVRGRYTVGSGDSFLAGLLASLTRGGSLPDALRTATGVAAANTLVRGAARFDAAEAMRLAALVTVSTAPSTHQK